MPAASFFPERLDLSYWGPALLLASVLCAAAGRALLPRYSGAAAPAIAFLLLWGSGHPLRAMPSPQSGASWGGLVKLRQQLEVDRLTPLTKLYAAPNLHLVLSFYTGLPFQSVAPVRKSYLDHYQGGVVYVESGGFLPATGPLTPAALQRAATADGAVLPKRDAENLSRLLRTAEYRTALNRDVLRSDCSLENVPAFGRKNLAKARELQLRDTDTANSNLLIFRGFNVKNWDQWIWRTVFFYRFVDPLSRSGPNLNFAGRLRGSHADVLTDEGWVIYRSRSEIDERKGPVLFKVLP